METIVPAQTNFDGFSPLCSFYGFKAFSELSEIILNIHSDESHCDASPDDDDIVEMVPAR